MCGLPLQQYDLVGYQQLDINWISGILQMIYSCITFNTPESLILQAYMLYLLCCAGHTQPHVCTCHLKLYHLMTPEQHTTSPVGLGLTCPGLVCMQFREGISHPRSHRATPLRPHRLPFVSQPSLPVRIQLFPTNGSHALWSLKLLIQTPQFNIQTGNCWF